MPNIYVFNAGHEESLIHQDSIYRTPKKKIAQIRLSLWPLMRYLVNDDDYILSGKYVFGDIILFDKNGNIVDLKSVSNNVFLIFWAIEPSLINYLGKLFLQKGIKIRTYSFSDIYTISNRKFSTYLSEYIIKKEKNIESILQPVWINNKEDNAFDIFCRHIKKIISVTGNGNIVIKRPYTSSGRGVMFFCISDFVRDSKIVYDKISKLTEFSIEPYCNIEEDWASEFFIDCNGRCSFVALSHFFQNKGKYIGNILRDQKTLWNKLSSQIENKYSLDKIIDLQKRFIESNLAGKYVGFLGIDMFTYRNSSNILCFNPFVEINLRMTMGLISHYIYKENPKEYNSKIFIVDCSNTIYANAKELDLWTKNNHFRVIIK